MAQDIEQILGKRIETLKDLKDAIKEYKDVLAGAVEGSEEWTNATKGLNTAQERLDKITKAAKGTLGQYNNSEKDSINTLKTRIKELNTERNAMDMNSKEYAEATQELKKLNDKLRESGTSAGDWKANVGNYAGSIKSAFGELGSAAGGLTGPLGAVNASMLKLAANPVGAVVLALVAALKLLSEGIKSSEENINKFNEILAPIKGLMDVIMRAIQSVTGKILDFTKKLMENETVIKIFKTTLQVIATAFTLIKDRIKDVIERLKSMWEVFKEIGERIESALKPVTEAINKVVRAIFEKLKPAMDFIISKWNQLASTKLGKALGFHNIELEKLAQAWEEAGEGVDKFTKEVKEAAEEEKKISEQEAALLKQKRELLIADAKLRGEIADLNLQIAEEQNKEEKDYKKIEDLIDEKTQKENALANNNIAIKKAELEIIKQRNALSDSNTKNLDAEAQAEAALIDATNALTQAEANGEKEKKKILQAKRADEQKKKTEAYNKAVKELTASLKALDEQYDDTIYAMGNMPEAPEGAKMDTDSVDAYYDELIQRYNDEYQAYKAMTDAKIAELERFIDVQKAAEQDVSAQEEQLAKLRKDNDRKYNDLLDKTQEANKDRTKTQKALYKEMVSDYANMLDSMSQLFEKNTVAYKVTATAKAIIDTFLAANAVMAEQQGGLVARLAAAAGVIAAGVANVASIWKVNPKGGNSQPTAAESAASQAPAIIDSTPYTYTRNVRTEEEEERLNQPVYVSVTDINNVQNRVKVVEEESTW